MRRFFARPDSFTEETVRLEASETRHLKNVLRMHEGDTASVFNGTGREFACVIESIGRESARLKILREIEPASKESNLELNVGIAILKGDKFDFVAQKLSELGARRIIPILSHRCDVEIRTQADAVKKVERWNRISFESSKQCGRAAITHVETPIAFSEFIAKEHSTGILFAEESGGSFEEFVTRNSGILKLTAIVGPEGGWEQNEIALARENKFEVVTLRGRIMRAETAAIVTTALLQNHFGDLK